MERVLPRRAGAGFVGSWQVPKVRANRLFDRARRVIHLGIIRRSRKTPMLYTMSVASHQRTKIVTNLSHSDSVSQKGQFQ
jgi:hypothetical protein